MVLRHSESVVKSNLTQSQIIRAGNGQPIATGCSPTRASERSLNSMSVREVRAANGAD